MGYEVDMQFRDVKFKEINIPEVEEILQELNETWQKKSDWCRFDSSLENIVDIFEDIGFELELDDNYCHITEFNRQKLGDHENMFIKLAPYLSDGEVVFHGEDNDDWKIVFKDGEHERVTREAL